MHDVIATEPIHSAESLADELAELNMIGADLVRPGKPNSPAASRSSTSIGALNASRRLRRDRAA